MNRHTIPLLSHAGLLGAVLLLFIGVQIAGAQEATTLALIAIDAKPEGNTATSLGPLDGCARVEPGAEIQIDTIVDAIPEDRRMIAFETRITYDPALLEVVANDYKLMLAAVGDDNLFAHAELNDTLPDSDGIFVTAIVDLASNDAPGDPPTPTPGSNTEAGAGTLQRVTLKGKAAGVSSVGIQFSAADLIYPQVIDLNNDIIGVDQLGAISIAVGQDCPPEALQPVITSLPRFEDIFPTPEGTPTPVAASPAATPGGDLDGSGDSNTGAIALIVALGGLGAAAAGAGGWVLLKRSKDGPNA